MVTPYGLFGTASAAASTAASITVTAPSRIPPGSLIVVFINESTTVGGTISSVTDTGGNTYVQGQGSNVNKRTGIFYTTGFVKTPSSVTVAFGGASNTRSVMVGVFTGICLGWGVGGVDVGTNASGSGTAVSTGATASTRETFELVVSHVTVGATSGVGVTGGNAADPYLGLAANAIQTNTIVAGTAIAGWQAQTVTSLGAVTSTFTAAGVSPTYDVSETTFVIERGGINPARLRPHAFSPGIAR